MKFLHVGAYLDMQINNPNIVKTHLCEINKTVESNRHRSLYIIVAEGLDFGIEGDGPFVVRSASSIHNSFNLTSNILSIYTVNCATNHSLFKCLPLGIHKDDNNRFDLILEEINDKQYEKNKLVYANFGLGSHHSRIHLWDQLAYKKFVYRAEYPNKHDHAAFYKYYKELAESKYCICPRGLGWDSYRVWESVALGVIPIVQDSHWARHWEHMGFVLTKQWNLDENLLLEEYDTRLKRLTIHRDHVLSKTYRDFFNQ